MASPAGDGPDDVIELRHLRVFCAVADAGSLTEAARRLGLTQSAVSQAVKRLETELGSVLIDREVRPLQLTGAGLRLRHHADPLLDEARRVAAMVRRAGESPIPEIQLGMVDSFATVFAPPIALDLRARAGRLALHSGFSAALAERFLQRRLDLIVTTESLDSHDGLVRHRLFRDPLLLVIPNGIPAAGLPRLCEQLPLIRYSPRSRLGLDIDIHLRRLGLEPPRRFEFDTTDTVLNLVAAGVGWAITTPLCLVHAKYRPGEAQVLPLPGPPVFRRFYVLARRGEQGDLPERLAGLCQETFRGSVAERFVVLAPWLEGGAGLGN